MSGHCPAIEKDEEALWPLLVQPQFGDIVAPFVPIGPLGIPFMESGKFSCRNNEGTTRRLEIMSTDTSLALSPFEHDVQYSTCVSRGLNACLFIRTGIPFPSHEANTQLS